MHRSPSKEAFERARNALARRVAELGSLVAINVGGSKLTLESDILRCMRPIWDQIMQGRAAIDTEKNV